MRKTMMLSAALFALAPAAFAQSATGAAAATPAPAEQMTPMPGMHKRMMAPAKPMPAAEIRPGHEPGVGDSFPASDKASNITAADSRSTIAPRLPVPAGGENATPAMLLADAQKALDARQSGRAQEALERAETAMLQRSVPADQAATPDAGQGVMQVQMARAALAKGDMAGAKKAVAAAMSAG